MSKFKIGDEVFIKAVIHNVENDDRYFIRYEDDTCGYHDEYCMEKRSDYARLPKYKFGEKVAFAYGDRIYIGKVYDAVANFPSGTGYKLRYLKGCGDLAEKFTIASEFDILGRLDES